MKTDSERPFGVTVLVVIQLLTVVSLAIDIFRVYQGSLFNFLPMANEVAQIPGASAVLIFQLVVAVGLWQLKRWAWFLVMISLGVGMSMSLWSYFNEAPPYGYMVVAVIMVFYLNQHEVQQAFERRSTAKDTG